MYRMKRNYFVVILFIFIIINAISFGKPFENGITASAMDQESLNTTLSSFLSIALSNLAISFGIKDTLMSPEYMNSSNEYTSDILHYNETKAPLAVVPNEYLHFNNEALENDSNSSSSYNNNNNNIDLLLWNNLWADQYNFATESVSHQKLMAPLTTANRNVNQTLGNNYDYSANKTSNNNNNDSKSSQVLNTTTTIIQDITESASEKFSNENVMNSSNVSAQQSVFHRGDKNVRQQNYEN